MKWDEFADGKGGEYLGRHPAFGLPTGAGIRRTCRKTFIRSSAIMKKAHTLPTVMIFTILQGWFASRSKICSRHETHVTGAVGAGAVPGGWVRQ